MQLDTSWSISKYCISGFIQTCFNNDFILKILVMTSFRKARPRKYFDTRFPNSCISALFITQTRWCWVLTETNCSTFQYNTTNQLQTCNRHYYYDNYPRKYQLFSNAALITSFNFKSLSCPVYTLPYEGRQSNMLLTRLVGKLTTCYR